MTLPQNDTASKLTRIPNCARIRAAVHSCWGQTMRIMASARSHRAYNATTSSHMPRGHGRDLPDAKKHGDHEKSAFRQCTLLQRLRRTMSKDSSPDSLKQTRRKAETRESAVRFDSFRFNSSALKRCRMERFHTMRLHTHHATCASGQKQKTPKWRVSNDILTIQRGHT